MSLVFGDTSFFVALANARDDGHAHALKVAAGLESATLITTDFVIVELGSYFSRSQLRPLFEIIIEDLANDPRHTVIPATRELFERGMQLFMRRPDKDWSLTDCISFVVMEERGISDALTADRHFEQAGFKALLASHSS